MGQKGPKSISQTFGRRNLVDLSFFNQKDHVSISVLYISYVLADRKCSKNAQIGSKGTRRGQKGPKSIS